MRIYLFFIILYIKCSSNKIIKNGVYNILTNHQYLSYHYRNLSSSQNFRYPNTFFRIRRIYKTLNNTFYTIEKLNKLFKLTIVEDTKLYFNKTEEYLSLWSFINTGNHEYVIKNENECYIKIENFEPLCEAISISNASKFRFYKIFSEVKQNISNFDQQLLEKEPIDVLIKYIDLRDPNLKRDGIHQIDKDYDNEELRYSIRSILMNIPWIRKIFILMPNQKVRFFKEYKYIKDKIVYVKDKSILGYDSSNSNSFQFIFWKMKQYGISDNIIIMDDDCFIGKKLKKSDFFYVQNNKVFPLIITSKFLKINQNIIRQSFESFKIKSLVTKEEQGSDIFSYSKFTTILFILNLFNFTSGQRVFIPKFTHNAIPANINDIKEIYKLVYESKYKYPTLVCNYRIPGFLQFQLFVVVFSFIKYNRKVKNIRAKYIALGNQNPKNYDFPLFCINKGPSNYSYLHYFISRIAMENKFYIPSPYEIIDNSLFKDIFNNKFDYENIFLNMENQNYLSSKLKYFFYHEIIYILAFAFLIVIKIRQ